MSDPERHMSDCCERIQEAAQINVTVCYMMYTAIFHSVFMMRNNSSIPEMAHGEFAVIHFRIVVALICESRDKCR